MKPPFLSLALAFILISKAGLAAPRTVMLEIPNMMCPVCPLTVKKALERVPGVRRVTVDYAGKTATVQFDDTAAAAEQLTAATGAAGYPSAVRREAK